MTRIDEVCERCVCVCVLHPTIKHPCIRLIWAGLGLAWKSVGEAAVRGALRIKRRPSLETPACASRHKTLNLPRLPSFILRLFLLSPQSRDTHQCFLLSNPLSSLLTTPPVPNSHNPQTDIMVSAIRCHKPPTSHLLT